MCCHVDRTTVPCTYFCVVSFRPVQISKRRFNQALFARLRPRLDGLEASTVACEPDYPVAAPSVSPVSPAGARPYERSSFCVGTYHMPCMFRVPPVMAIHTTMLVKHMARLAGSDPFVLAGDFNFVPDSACYKIVTEGGRGGDGRGGDGRGGRGCSPDAIIQAKKQPTNLPACLPACVLAFVCAYLVITGDSLL